MEPAPRRIPALWIGLLAIVLCIGGAVLALRAQRPWIEVKIISLPTATAPFRYEIHGREDAEIVLGCVQGGAFDHQDASCGHSVDPSGPLIRFLPALFAKVGDAWIGPWSQMVCADWPSTGWRVAAGFTARLVDGETLVLYQGKDAAGAELRLQVQVGAPR